MEPTIELDHQGAYLFKGNISNQFTYNGPGDQQTDDAIKQSQNPPKPNDSDVNEIEKIQEKRLKTFYRYADAFSDLEKLNLVQIPFTPDHSQGNGHIFYLLLKSFNHRCNFIEYMFQNGISTPFHYIPLHSSPAGKVFGRSHGKLSITDDLSSRLVRLPSYFTLSENSIEYIIKKVLYYFE